MKKLIFILFAVAAWGFQSSAQNTSAGKVEGSRSTSQQELDHSVGQQQQKIYIRFGRVSRNCGGFGICIFDIDITLEELAGFLNALKTPNNKLKLVISPDFYNKNQKSFVNSSIKIDEDFSVDLNTSRSLGFSSAYIIKAGQYPIIYNAASRNYECNL